jgi:hypothetical protein
LRIEPKVIQDLAYSLALKDRRNDYQLLEDEPSPSKVNQKESGTALSKLIGAPATEFRKGCAAFFQNLQ